MKKTIGLLCLYLICHTGPTLSSGMVPSAPGQQQKVQALKATAVLQAPELKPVTPMLVRLPTPKIDEFSFSLTRERPFYYHDFCTLDRGRITVEISYSGEMRLEAMLLPPGEQKEPVAKEIGVNRLRLQADIDPAWMRTGKKWTVLIRQPENQLQPKSLAKTAQLQTLQKAPLRGNLKVTYPALLKLRPSPYVPVLVGWIRQALQGKGTKEWRDLLVQHPGLKPRLQGIVQLYDTLPERVKGDLYAGPYLKQESLSLQTPSSRNSALDAQLSASIGAQTHVVPKPVPKIKGIYPQLPLANYEVVVGGENFIFPGKLTVVILEREIDGGKYEAISLVTDRTLILNKNWLWIHLPANISETDNYKVTVSHAGGTASTQFKVYASAHQTARYTGRINQVTCIDESNPERPNWLVGSDEVYAMIAVIRAEGKNTSSWQVRTDVKGGFDDGESKEVNWRFFDSSGAPAKLGDGVLLSVFLIEDDPGSPPSEVQDLIRTVLVEATRNIVLWGEGPGSMPFSLLLSQIFSDIIGAFVDLIFSALEDDPLGVQSYSFDARQLYEWVRSEHGTFERSFLFENDSDTGSYRTRFEWKLW